MVDLVALSIRAKQLLDEKVMDDIFDLLRQDLVDELLRTAPDESARRENIYSVLQGLDRLELKFAWACTQNDFENAQSANFEDLNRRNT